MADEGRGWTGVPMSRRHQVRDRWHGFSATITTASISAASSAVPPDHIQVKTEDTPLLGTCSPAVSSHRGASYATGRPEIGFAPSRFPSISTTASASRRLQQPRLAALYRLPRARRPSAPALRRCRRHLFRTSVRLAARAPACGRSTPTAPASTTRTPGSSPRLPAVRNNQ